MFTEDDYFFDKRVQMGRTIAVQHGDRLWQLVATIIEDRSDTQDWTGIYDSNTRLSDYQRSSLRHWIERSEDMLPDYRVQHMLFVVLPYQYDFIVMAVGNRAARVAEQQTPRIMNELGIRLSKKEDSKQPFSQNSSPWAEFDLTGPRLVIKPHPEPTKNFEHRLTGLRLNKGKLIGEFQMQEFCSLFEFISRFSSLYFTPVRVAHAFLRVPYAQNVLYAQ